MDKTTKKKTIKVFAEAPIKTVSRFNINDNDNLPPSLLQLRKQYRINDRAYNTLNNSAQSSYKNISIIEREIRDYLTGILGDKKNANDAMKHLYKDFKSYLNHNYPSLNNDKLLHSHLSRLEFVNDNSRIVSELGLEPYAETLKIEDEFNSHPDNPVITKQDDVFIKEAGNLRKVFRNNPNTTIDIVPVYGSQDTTKIKENIRGLTSNDDLIIMGHSGSKFGGIDNKWWNNAIKYSEACKYLGSCDAERVVKEGFSDNAIIYRPDSKWLGVNPKSDNLIDAMYSRVPSDKGDIVKTPVDGVDYKTNKYAKGGFIQDKKSNQIGEVTVYSKRKYVDELKKQQEKYLADMAKYKQDSVQWVKARESYQKNLQSYNDSLKLSNWSDKYKDIDYNRVPFEILTNEEGLQYIKDTPNRSSNDEHIGFLGTPFLKHDNKYESWENNYYGGVTSFPGSKEYKYKTFYEDRDKENIKILELFNNQKIKPSHFVNTDAPNDNKTGSLYPIYHKPKSVIPKEPIIPTKPKSPAKVNYDPKYENLKMHSLWPTKAKQDTSAIIGTLNPLQHQMDTDKGFTIGEAMRTFPPEILQENKIDMIDNQIKGKNKLAKGGTIPSKSIRFNTKPNTTLMPMPNKAFTNKEFAKGKTYLNEYNRLVNDENIIVNTLKDTTLNPFEITKSKAKLNDIYQLKNDLYKHQTDKMALGGIDPLSLTTSAISGAVSLYNAAAAKADMKTQSNNVRQMENQQRYENDSLFLKDFNTSGSATEYYAKGGSFKNNARQTGNIANFKPIAPNTFAVDGKKHESGGVKMGNKEIEGGEVIKFTPEGIKVLSDRDEYFGYSPADNAKMNPMAFENEFNKQEMMKPNKNKSNKAAFGAEWFYNLQKTIGDMNYKNMGVQDNNGVSMVDFARNNMEYPTANTSTTATKSTNTNPLIYPSAANEPFKFKPQGIADIVPASKGTISPAYTSPGVPSPNPDKKGSKFGEHLPYFIDNIANAITTGMTPNPIPPAMIPLTKFNTDVDVNPMIDSIKGNERGSVNYINNNISDSNVATAMKASVGNQSTTAINDVRSKEFNMENQIKNQEAQANLYPKMQNQRAINDFGEQVVNKRLGVNSAINENFNNLSRDFIDIRDKANLTDRDNKRLDIQLAMDTEGYLAPLIKSGQFNNIVLDPNFDLSKLSAANRQAVAEARATNNMRRNGK